MDKNNESKLPRGVRNCNPGNIRLPKEENMKVQRGDKAVKGQVIPDICQDGLRLSGDVPHTENVQEQLQPEHAGADDQPLGAAKGQ
ncbi:MAG: hypothetical protein ACI3ZY_10415 [Parabacteroides sp.]